MTRKSSVIPCGSCSHFGTADCIHDSSFCSVLWLSCADRQHAESRMYECKYHTRNRAPNVPRQSCVAHTHAWCEISEGMSRSHTNDRNHPCDHRSRIGSKTLRHRWRIHTSWRMEPVKDRKKGSSHFKRPRRC